MQSATIERLRQAFPALYTSTRFECDDRWFSMLMTLGTRLEGVLRDERAKPDSQQGADVAGEARETDTPALADECVEVVMETSDSLEVSLHVETPALMEVIADFHAQMQALQRKGATAQDSQGDYDKLHNAGEQTLAEEAVRADQGLYDTIPATPSAGEASV